MAEAALFGIAESVLKQLGSPALNEFRLLWGHKEQFDKLEDTVTTVRNVLEDADRKQATDAAVQGWLARLRAVLYEADDMFDSISAKVLLEKNKKGTEIGKKVGHFLSKPYQFAFLVKNAHKVKKIRERFDDIAGDIQRFNFLPNQSEVAPMSIIGREPTHSFIPRNEVIGREQETEEVVRMLLSDCSQQQQGGVSVIAVIGIGGLGKTTLAQLAYNDDRVQKDFDLCMWACVNYFSHLKQVVITLLKSATMKEPENLDIDQLQSKLRKEIEGKRFLLVLDDVWDENPQNWRRLKQLLSSGKDGSKVLATTRSDIVAKTLCAAKPYFDLKGMSDESAWLLFKKVAFGEEGDQNSSEFEQLGRQIVRKCANVPLAIVTVASLLREKDKERWFPLVNDELSKVIPDEYKKITHVLEFSYNELPYSVKRCFGYCSLFPKDYVFIKDGLILLWIAQGFIEPLNNQSLEDRAEEYFFYLVNRCFFQVDHRYETLGQVTYQMHDLMQDLATTVARSENVLIDQTEHSSWDKNVRHVSSSYQPKSMVDSVCSFSHSKSLRTFLYPHRYNYFEENISLGKNDLKKLMSAFRSLRVLDLSDLGIEKVPTSIGELIHLRFLHLSKNYMRRLPRSICSLPHLQFLIIRKCKALKEVPEELGDLLSLRLLDLSENNGIVRLPSAICSLPHLQSLVLQMCRYLKELPEELGDLLSLRFLNLSFSNSLERLPSSTGSLPHLQSLILEGCHSLKELPEELGDLVSLRHLVLECCSSLVKMPPGLAALTSLVTLDRLVVHNPSGGLKYLESLDNLTGSLQIQLPETEWENSKMDAERSFLSRKSRLRALEITHIRKSVELATTVNTGMNAIQPPPNIVNLRISYFGGKEMPQWVSCLQKLVFLKLYRCERCTELPSFSLLPSLKELYISDMYSMVAIEDSMFYEPHSFFLSLETLSILEMPNLTSWWLQAPTVLPAFPRVTFVKIVRCPKLTRCMPMFPLVEDLSLEGVPEEIIWSEVTFSASHGSNVPKKLEIIRIRDLSSIAATQIRQLSAFQEVRISECKQLKSVSWNGFSYLTSLERLEIGGCEEFNWDGEEAEVRRILLPRVRHLEIPTVNRNLFKALKDMTSLETLIVEERFNQVVQEEEEALPWKQLQSQKLEKLSLGFEETFSMRSNQRLLHGIEELTSLKELTLRRCKELFLSWRVLLDLPYLQDLSIAGVEKVIEVESDPVMIQTQPISHSIQRLTISGILGEWVNDIPWKSFPFLKHLSLLRMRNLSPSNPTVEGLPEGIQHLAALESFHIFDNKEVVSLPHWISSLSSLKNLVIWQSSSELKKRCERLIGEDWPKIQHIPNIRIE